MSAPSAWRRTAQRTDVARLALQPLSRALGEGFFHLDRASVVVGRLIGSSGSKEVAPGAEMGALTAGEAAVDVHDVTSNG